MAVVRDYSLRGCNTFGVEARAAFYARVESRDGLAEVLADPEVRGRETLVLGGGSNVLFTRDFDGLVVHNAIGGLAVVAQGDDCAVVEAGAGVVWHDLVTFCLDRGLGGLENLALIPGSVGASPIQNIGAYGVEMKDAFESLDALEIATGAIRAFTRDECRFGYRNSVFKGEHRGRYVILAVRFFALRQGMPGALLMLAVALLGMAAFLWTLLDPRAGGRRPALEGLRLAGVTLMALTSLYAAAWIAFYALPLGTEGLRGLAWVITHPLATLRDLGNGLADMLRNEPIMAPFSVLGFILLLYTGTLVVLTPLAVPFLSLRAWRQATRALAGQAGSGAAALITAGTLAACLVLFFLVNRQPQEQAFTLLQRPPASIEEARSLLERSDSIRAGLLNAYLAPFRYISAEGEVAHIREIYRAVFRLSQSQAFRVQRLYEGLASPLLYRPVHRPDPANPVDNHALVEEPKEAARLYQRFFDAPIADAERAAIVQAVRYTWSSAQAEDAWLAVDDREVYLARQELTVQADGDLAEFELHEVFRNQTAERQEVIYYFNLPESAALTGLWLGTEPEKARADRFQVAPRGAAQAVYREQVRVSVDPALLEQIGPRQYRLRVYPIEPVRITFDEQTARSDVQGAPSLYLWVAWRQMAEGGAWRLPRMAYLRNVYWDEATERLVNGQPMEVESEDWLPAELDSPAPAAPRAHRVDLPGGQTVLAIPADPASLPDLPAGLRLAVVLDRSRSIQEHAAQMSAALEALKTLDDLAKPVDVYLTASPYRGEAPSLTTLAELDPQGIVYFGGQDASQLIVQYSELHAAARPGAVYDAVLVLTDNSGYELGASGPAIAVPDSPVWMVHVGGSVPLGYDDGTLDAIQASGGGVAGSLEEALQRLTVVTRARAEPGAGPGEAARVVDLLGGYVWTVLPTARAEAVLPPGGEGAGHAAQDPFTALAVRRLILAEQQRRRGTIDQAETLDALHALAQEYEIVTPYSSMIVLVNLRQQALLDQLSRLGDRYQREVESLGETTPASPVPLVGVPEPHEWLLLSLAAALLACLALRRRAAS